MAHGKAWTPKDIEYLKEKYPQAMIRIGEIMEHLGRTEDAIRLKASRLGLARSFMTGEDVQLMNCYGRDYDESCIIRCPGHHECLMAWTEAIKIDGSIIVGQNKLTILDKVDRDQLYQALKVLKAVKEAEK